MSRLLKMKSLKTPHRRWIFQLTVIMIIPLLFLGCDVFSSGEDIQPVTFEYDFSESDHGWEPFFTDYPVGWGDKMELTSDYRNLPEPLETDKNSYFISAINHSDDVKMLFRRQVSGLEPNTTYSVSYTIEFATAAPSNCFGIGGPPGEAVKVIVASGPVKPEPIVDEDSHDDGYYLLNIQHLDDSAEWYNNAIMGDVANSRECEDGWEFELKEVASGPAHDQVTSDEQGNVWLLFGTRSGFEGQTELYYTYFKAELTK